MRGLQVSGEKEFFAKMVVDAVSHLDPDSLDMSLLGTKKVQGGGLRDSFLVDGVAFKKTFSYAGFEMQKKSYSNPKILALNIELELKSEKENAEVTLWPPACLGDDSDGMHWMHLWILPSLHGFIIIVFWQGCPAGMHCPQQAFSTPPKLL